MTLFRPIPSLAFVKAVLANYFCTPSTASVYRSESRMAIFTSTCLYCELSPLVVSLCDAISPDAILRRIRAVIVNSLNSQAIRAFPHVGNKALERGPFSTHMDTTAPVVFVRWVLRVIAAGFHVSPAVVLRGCLAVNARQVRIHRRLPLGFGL
ncbi:hypothetical protein LCGC14_1689720 [marine sediment metagenome]|uniref:Uncharacterized protein n=1 Tax=marine sediment metagenome TaxID=412755 RepID=A0A0F9I8T2_9ZZZZ